jgi:hypothetical protein
LKKNKNKISKSLQTKEVIKNPPSVNDLLQKYAKIKNAKTALRLLSKIIEGFIKKEIDSRHAKDAAYLLSVYVQLHSASLLEGRLSKLEERMIK